MSYNAPSWEHTADGVRPGAPVEDPEPGVPRHGGSSTQPRRWTIVSSRLSDTQQAMVRTARWCTFHVFPHIVFDLIPRTGFPGVVASPPLAPSPLVRLRLPVWPSTRRPWPPLVSMCDFGSCRRGFALESAAARVCREAGSRVTLNVRVSDLDVPPRSAHDQRRLEVLFHGGQLAITFRRQRPCPVGGPCLRSRRPMVW